jgi:hypothetical protein
MVLDALRALPPTPMLILAFLCPALEASTMLGVSSLARSRSWSLGPPQVAILGYLAGASLVVVQNQLGVVNNIVLGVLATVGLAIWLRPHVRRRQSRL